MKKTFEIFIWFKYKKIKIKKIKTGLKLFKKKYRLNFLSEFKIAKKVLFKVKRGIDNENKKKSILSNKFLNKLNLSMIKKKIKQMQLDMNKIKKTVDKYFFLSFSIFKFLIIFSWIEKRKNWPKIIKKA